MRSAKLLPVVFVHFSTTQLDHTHYIWTSIRAAALCYKHPVHLITSNKTNLPADLEQSVFLNSDVDLLATSSELAEFRRVYVPVHGREPFERHNYERFHAVLELMRLRQLPDVILLDSDVVLTNHFASDISTLSCDLIASGSDADVSWKSLYWVLWAGSALLREHVLSAFVRFLPHMFTFGKLRALVGKKRAHKPNICDMTAWYIFASWATNGSLHDHWAIPKFFLPTPPDFRFTLCDSRRFGFDHMHAHKKANSQFTLVYNAQSRLYCPKSICTSKTTCYSSIHFQDKEKSNIAGLANAMHGRSHNLRWLSAGKL